MTVSDNCESNATACELSSSSMAIDVSFTFSMAIKVSTVFPVACLMREIGPQALSHARFVALFH